MTHLVACLLLPCLWLIRTLQPCLCHISTLRLKATHLSVAMRRTIKPILTYTADTPFEDGSFRLTLTFTDAYPNKPPTVRFVSRMFHPNIYVNGELCLDILQNRWSPTYDVAAILTSVQSLLNDPNPGR